MERQQKLGAMVRSPLFGRRLVQGLCVLFLVWQGTALLQARGGRDNRDERVGAVTAPESRLLSVGRLSPGSALPRQQHLQDTAHIVGGSVQGESKHVATDLTHPAQDYGDGDDDGDDGDDEVENDDGENDDISNDNDNGKSGSDQDVGTDQAEHASIGRAGPHVGGANSDGRPGHMSRVERQVPWKDAFGNKHGPPLSGHAMPLAGEDEREQAHNHPNGSAARKKKRKLTQAESATRGQPPVPQRPVAEVLKLLQRHRFVFVIGHHFSGTSLAKMLLELHPDISGMHNTHKPEDEGQHVQSVYQATRLLGGIYAYAFNPAARLTEDSFVSDDTRAKLFNQWSRYWDLGKTALLEKSPRHMVMTRFLQHIFGPQRTSFVAVVRHPLGCSRRLMQGKWYGIVKDCYRRIITHWLVQHEALLSDVAKLHSVRLFRYEDFLRSDVSESLSDIYQFIGLEAFKANITVTNSTEEIRDIEKPHLKVVPEATGRKLLFYYGSRAHVTVRSGTFMSWTKLWQQVVLEDKDGKCQGVIEDLEEKVNQYGYSLKTPMELDNAAPAFEAVRDAWTNRHGNTV